MTEEYEGREWREESLEAYASLKLPTLYDMLLTQESLAVQVKKQNIAIERVRKELSSEHKEELEQLMGEVEERNGEIDRLEGLLAKQQELLLGVIDSFYYLLNGISGSAHRVEEALFATYNIFTRGRSTRSKVLEQTASMAEAAEVARGKMVKYLQELGISLIIPEKGESFSPAQHRAIDHSAGGASGTVAKVLRVGFQKGGKVLRYADVTIYK